MGRLFTVTLSRLAARSDRNECTRTLSKGPRSLFVLDDWKRIDGLSICALRYYFVAPLVFLLCTTLSLAKIANLILFWHQLTVPSCQ